MKILVITHEYPPIGGGGANACLNLSREYGNTGHHVTIITVWYEGLKEEETDHNIHIIRLKARRKYPEHCGFPEMLDFLWRAVIRADQRHRAEHFDICQVFFAIPSGPVGFYLKKRYKLPYIIRFGGGDIPGFQERFQFLYKIIGPFEKMIWKYADALVANSEGLKNLANRFYDKREITIITNGVSQNQFSAADSSGMGDCHEQSAEVRLLFVSRLIERKGLQFIIPMLSELNEKSGRRVSLTIVGDGPYRPHLEKIAAEHKLEGLVSFVGQKDKKELPSYYRQADIFILPSRKEGMPNVVLEAMASGLPIVMTACEGSGELINGNGYAVPVGGFKEKLLELCNNDALRRKMGERSVRIVRESFRWEKIAAEYVELMEAVVH